MNARRLGRMLLLPALVLGCGAAQAHGAHEHGVAQMDVAQDGALLQIELSTPATNVVGFEHRPRDEREHGLLREAVAALEQGNALLSLSTPAGCTLRDARILSSLLSDEDEHDEDDQHAHDHHDHDHDDHVDMFIAWRFDCAAPAALREMNAQALFARFSAMETVRVQAVLPRGQAAGTLTARQPIFRF